MGTRCLRHRGRRQYFGTPRPRDCRARQAGAAEPHAPRGGRGRRIDRRRRGHSAANSRTSSSAPRPTELGFQLPDPKQYGVAMLFLPQDDDAAPPLRADLRRAGRRRRAEGAGLARRAHRQPLPGRSGPGGRAGRFGRRSSTARAARTKTWSGGCTWSASGSSAACARRSATAADEFYVPSMSCRTIVYKGMFLAPQLFAYYPDLADPRVQTALAIVHQRYSTNTFPSWRLAQPFRMIAHNGEINTLRGNANRLQGREKTMACADADRRHVGAVSDPPARRKRLGLFRQRHGIAGPRRPLGAARHDDDDSRGVRAAVLHFDRQAGVLRVSRRDHGAVGRPGGHGVHRRPAGRRHAWTATACGPAATS